MNTVQNFRAFLAVIETGSFSGAARRLGLSASVITKRIGAVEKEVGELVFLRSTRRLELTTAGRELISRVREFLGAYERAINISSSGSRELTGSLRIKAPTSFTAHFLGEILNEFLLKHPKINIDLQLTNRPVNPLTENLDMVITGLPTSFDGVEELPLCPFRRIVCAAPLYLQQMGEPIHPSDLQNHRCLLYSYVSAARVWTFKSTSTGDIDVGVNGPFHTNDIEAMHCGAVSGLGVAILPRYRVQESLANGSLVEILGLYELPDLWIKVQRPLHHNKSALLASLTDHLVSRVQYIRARHPAL